ncbi:MAG: hypothetical protein K940chlam5_01583 [Candidatus Anoxychlamydiales bacterium]|nr:hypothetical protein [Candidatus Anoxychlamydiales bacterium]
MYQKSNLAGIGKLSRQRLSKVLQYTHQGCITSKLVSKYLEVSLRTARGFLNGWAKNGWVYRIQRGVYLPIELSLESLDQTFIDPWIIAEGLYSPCYIGGWSAAEYWDFTEQIFEKTIVFTSQHINGKIKNIKNISFLISKLNSDKMFGLKTIWKEQIKIQISDPHKTIIDMLNDPAVGGGIRLIIDIFKKYLSSSYINLEILIEYAKKMKNRAIFKRLGFLLSIIKPEEKDIINKCIQYLSKGNSKLDPKLRSRRLVKKWNLWIPENFDITKVSNDS